MCRWKMERVQCRKLMWEVRTVTMLNVCKPKSAVLLMVLTVALFSPSPSIAQGIVPGCVATNSTPPYVCQGDKGVYNASAGGITNAHSYIDASVLTATSGDVCAHISA